MTFLKLKYAPVVFILVLLITILFFRENKRVFSFIKSTFFKNKGFIATLRSICFYLGLFLLGVSVLDPRGPEEKLDSTVKDQKTIIIIDSSASMLAEDVRPNRYKKSLLMARHFVKKAFGHKISIVLFSDTQKRLVPFTDDLDLLDARIAGLEKVDLYDGGSNISQAIKESLGYFRLDQKVNSGITGNLLVFTDSEGHDDGFAVETPEGVSLAIVGVGTARGARIPNRDKYGVFRGYKKYKGKEVVSKLNESWLKSLSDKIETYQFWIANSYTIPTEEILSFFNVNYEARLSEAKVTIRPVEVGFFLLPALILFFISFILYLPKNFYPVAFILLFVLPENTLGYTSKELEDILKNEEVDQKTKIKLAETYLKDKEFEFSKILYEEVGEKNLNGRSRNNLGLAHLGEKNPSSALKVWGRLQKDIRNGDAELSPDEQETLRKNVLLALQRKKEQKKQDQKNKKKDSKNKKQKEGEGDPKKSDQGKESDPEKQDDKGKESKDGKEGKDGKRNEDDDSKTQKGDEGKASDNESKSKEEKDFKDKPKSLEETQDDIRKKRKMVKVPAIIKQIMSDDRSLQQKYIDTSTNKPSISNKKDW